MDKFIKLLGEAIEREDEIKMDDCFRDYDEWNSLAYLSIIAFIDENYNVQIEEDEFNKLKTVQDIFDAVTK